MDPSPRVQHGKGEVGIFSLLRRVNSPPPFGENPPEESGARWKMIPHAEIFRARKIENDPREPRLAYVVPKIGQGQRCFTGTGNADVPNRSPARILHALVDCARASSARFFSSISRTFAAVPSFRVVDSFPKRENPYPTKKTAAPILSACAIRSAT